ncbi:integrase arm-type DNA-binding domain-containing protein [Salmonella enterica]|nr:integrase arm-type DNA-binding domain-containing protein [Salmonella enterica]
MPLTNIEIKNAQPKDREYIMSDSGGLVILIKPSGAKLWRYRYSINAKKQKLSLGSYPEISLAQARIRAADARAKVAQGISPVTERREKKEASKVVNSFEGVCLEWQATRLPQWSEIYAADTKRLFERDVFPVLGKRPIGDIQPLELLELLRKIEARGANELATKVRRRCGEVYAYAIVTGRAKYNPARDLATAMQRFQRGHYASLDVSELPAFLAALKSSTGNIMVNFAVRLLMLTGLRPGELRKGEWREVDFDNHLSCKQAPPNNLTSIKHQKEKYSPNGMGLNFRAPPDPESIIHRFFIFFGHFAYKTVSISVHLICVCLHRSCFVCMMSA